MGTSNQGLLLPSGYARGFSSASAIDHLAYSYSQALEQLTTKPASPRAEGDTENLPHYGVQALVHKQEEGHWAADRHNLGTWCWGQLEAKNSIGRTGLANWHHQSCRNWSYLRCEACQPACRERNAQSEPFQGNLCAKLRIEKMRKVSASE